VSDPLEGVKLKIERANAHIIEVTSMIEAFANANPFTTFDEHDPVNGNLTVKLRAIKEPPPAKLSVIVGEILYLLRSALDHLVTTVATKRGVVIIERTGFPIEFTLDKFEDTINNRKIEQRFPDLARVLRELKPYKGGNDLLWWLHWLNGQEKHQTLVTTIGGGIPGEIKLRGTFPRSNLRAKVYGGGWFPMNEDHALYTVGRGSKGHADIKIYLNISFSEIETIEFEPIATTLQQFCDLTRGIVKIFKDRFFKS
jgi:hypothetical protein